MPLAIEVAFVLLSVAMLADWLTHRERRRGYLAVAFGSLTLLVLIAPSLSDAGPYGRPLIDLAILLFLLSGWALLMFRDSFIPLGARARGFVAVVIVLVAALAAILVTWGVCVVEPIVTLWLASRGRPAVEGARMRSLSLGYAGLVVVIMFGTLGGSLVTNDAAQLVVNLVALAIVPMLFISFYPPAWLRRLWSQPEEEELRQGLHSLLTFSPDRVTQAARALEWATRLVGGK